MGQKINPIGFRVGINRTWDSRWYADRDYAKLLHQDLKLRDYLMGRLSQAGVGKVVIEKLRQELSNKTGTDVSLNILEIRKPEIDAKLVAENISSQLERRVAFR